MADLSQATPPSLPSLWKRLDKAWAIVVLVPFAVALLDPARLGEILGRTAGSFGHTAVFILFAITLVAYVKASGAETLLARAFEGDQRRMIVLAALLGGLSPFCSCEIIPFIAALLAVGAPLGPVMALWLASPLMDPAMFTLTWGELGLPFAAGKAAAAVGIGLVGGFVTMAFARSPMFAEPLREAPTAKGCCGAKKPFRGTPLWRFWQEPARRETFRTTWVENALFLGKWLLVAYLFEAVMIAYGTTDYVARWLGGEGPGTIVLAALIGMPAYLNGYAAVGLIGGLADQGMSQGAAMAFVLAGGVSCIPAAVAVWALVKSRVFLAYLGFGLGGSVLAGMIWQAVA